MENLTEKLKAEYQRIFTESQPDWAVKKLNQTEIVHPAIPFVGKNYEKHRILVYASAENLAKYDGYLDIDSNAIGRRRGTLDSKKAKPIFPNIHIQPIDDGSLLLVSAYIASKLDSEIEINENPYDFIENIAADNFGKFSIHSKKKKNVDYARDIDYLKHSFDYIKADIDILKPEILIIPKSIYDTIRKNDKDYGIYSIMKRDIAQRVPIYQINARNVNNRKCISKFPQTKPKEPFLSWHKKLDKVESAGIKGKTNQNFYSVYTYLDECIKHIG